MTEPPIQLLDLMLPDQVVMDDMREVLRKIADNPIELEEQEIQLPQDPDIHIVTKIFSTNYFRESVFYDYWVLLAIGAVSENPDRTLSAAYCFSTLWYNHEAELLSVDFHEKMR